jgi:hypothetical protein
MLTRVAAVVRPFDRWLAFIALAMLACSSSAPPDGEPSSLEGRIDATAVVARTLALVEDPGPRPMGSAAAMRTAEQIEAELRALGLRPERLPVGVQDLPPITVGGRVIFPAARVDVPEPNLIVRFAPRAGVSGAPDATTPSALLIMGHYDSVAGAPGAIDNGVAVALLLDLARALVVVPPARPVILAWPASEEVRLAGSTRLAAQLGDEVGLAVSLDLVGTDGPLTLNGLGPRLGLAWLRWIAGVADRADVAIEAPLAHRLVSRRLPQLERSDHSAFAARGVPAFHLYNRGVGDDHIYLAYHSPLDDAEAMSPPAIADVGRFLDALVHAAGPLPPAGGDLGLWLPLPGKLIVPMWLAVAVELALAAGALATLLMMLHRSWLRRKDAQRTGAPRGRGLGLLAGVAAWLVAWAAVIGLEALLRGGHPLPWAHAPGRWIVAEALLAAVLAGALLAGAGRIRPVTGQDRWLAAAIAPPLVLGIVTLALGAPELAWLWLLPAAGFAAMRWLRRFAARLALAGLSLLPLLGIASPAHLREAVFNGFWPPGVPLAAYLAVIFVPYGAVIAWTVRGAARRWPRRPRWAWAIVAALGVAAVAALTIPSTQCTAAAFARAWLSCEVI